MSKPYRIAVVVGSLRKEAFTLRVAQALQKLAPSSLSLELVTLEGLSFFNQDLEGHPPADWVQFRATLQASDGVLIVTPEYNRSIPGVLKNAIDIASRPYGQSSLNGRPVGIIGNSPGAHGGVSAVKHLQQILPGICGPILQQPEVYLGAVASSFNDVGELNEAVEGFLKTYLETWAAWVSRHNADKQG
jgi:chromate reductase